MKTFQKLNIEVAIVNLLFGIEFLWKRPVRKMKWKLNSWLVGIANEKFTLVVNNHHIQGCRDPQVFRPLNFAHPSHKPMNSIFRLSLIHGFTQIPNLFDSRSGCFQLCELSLTSIGGLVVEWVDWQLASVHFNRCLPNISIVAVVVCATLALHAISVCFLSLWWLELDLHLAFYQRCRVTITIAILALFGFDTVASYSYIKKH